MSSTQDVFLVYLSDALAAVLLSGGCTPNSDRSNHGESAYWEKGKAGGSLTFAVDEEITDFNPFYGFETMAELLVHNLIFAAPLRQHRPRRERCPGWCE